jgi:hypothetical protein
VITGGSAEAEWSLEKKYVAKNKEDAPPSTFISSSSLLTFLSRTIRRVTNAGRSSKVVPGHKKNIQKRRK